MVTIIRERSDVHCWSLKCPVPFHLLCMAVGKYTKCIELNSAFDLFVESCEIVRLRMHQSRHKYGAVGVISVTLGAWCRIRKWAEDLSLSFRPAVEMLQVLVISHLGCHVGATFTIVNVPEVQCCTRLDQKTYDTGGASCFCMQGLH